MPLWASSQMPDNTFDKVEAGIFASFSNPDNDKAGFIFKKLTIFLLKQKFLNNYN